MSKLPSNLIVSSYPLVMESPPAILLFVSCVRLMLFPRYFLLNLLLVCYFVSYSCVISLFSPLLAYLFSSFMNDNFTHSLFHL